MFKARPKSTVFHMVLSISLKTKDLENTKDADVSNINQKALSSTWLKGTKVDIFLCEFGRFVRHTVFCIDTCIGRS